MSTLTLKISIYVEFIILIQISLKELFQNIYFFFIPAEAENCSVMVIVVGNGHGHTSSNPERDCILHSTKKRLSSFIILNR